VNNFHLGTIISVQSPNRFTKFAGFDANGDIFGNNDRVGIERVILSRVTAIRPLTCGFHGSSRR